MVIKMYKGSSECLADIDQVPVMENAGWSRKKAVKKAKAVKAREAKADVKVDTTDEAKVERPKTAPKKRRSVAKK